MKEKTKLKKTKEDIARQFDLPERKSKIAYITKEKEVYCLCRSTDSSRFMISCDECLEWYHGDCVNITEEESKHIKHYYCQLCRQKNESLQTIFRLVPADREPQKQQPQQQSAAQQQSKKANKSNPRRAKENGGVGTARKTATNCGNCEGCCRENCGKCSACTRPALKKRCKLRICKQRQHNSRKRADAAAKHAKHAAGDSRTRKRPRSNDSKTLGSELMAIRHCYGPRCCKTARPQSKYCSDECGVKLAETRLEKLLPMRLQQWNQTECHATKLSKERITALDAQLEIADAVLLQLDGRMKELDLIVAFAKQMKIDENWAQDAAESEDEVSVYCITCGHEIHARTAIRHMEKCFNKTEALSLFCSSVQARLPGNIICDYHNAASNTYCKRLTVLCPEHAKDPKVKETDVCGAPLLSKFMLPNGQFCRAPKKSCNKHHAWEKIRRAEIDLERVRQWMKIERLSDEKRLIEDDLERRGGLLALLLHSTVDHDAVAKSNAAAAIACSGSGARAAIKGHAT